MNEEQKEIVRKEARGILDKFAKSLEKVKVSDTKKEVKGDGMRKEGEGLNGDEDFRKRMFENAPHKEGDCIIAEKGAWTN